MTAATQRVTHVSEREVDRLGGIVALCAARHLHSEGVSHAAMMDAIDGGTSLHQQIEALPAAPAVLLNAFATVEALRWRLSEGL